MKRVKNVTEQAEEIKVLLEGIMSQTFYKCKSEDPEVRAEANEINSAAHRCSVLVDRLVYECKREL